MLVESPRDLCLNEMYNYSVLQLKPDKKETYLQTRAFVFSRDEVDEKCTQCLGGEESDLSTSGTVLYCSVTSCTTCTRMNKRKLKYRCE